MFNVPHQTSGSAKATVSDCSSPLLVINTGRHGLQTSVNVVPLFVGVFGDKCPVSLDGRVLSVVGLVLVAHVIVINVVEAISTGLTALTILFLLLGNICDNLATRETATIECSGAFGSAFGILEADSHDA